MRLDQLSWMTGEGRLGVTQAHALAMVLGALSVGALVLAWRVRPARLFVVLAVAMFRIMRKAQDSFARVVTGGVLVWVIGQAFVNIAVVLGMLPVLGVLLPLISAGGSSLLAVLLAFGVVLSFTRALRQALQ